MLIRWLPVVDGLILDRFVDDECSDIHDVLCRKNLVGKDEILSLEAFVILTAVMLSLLVGLVIRERSETKKLKTEATLESD